MLKDTDDRLLCPECGDKLRVSVRVYFCGPAYYDSKAYDHIDYEMATEHAPTETAYVDLQCECGWNTEKVYKYLEETQ